MKTIKELKADNAQWKEFIESRKTEITAIEAKIAELKTRQNELKGANIQAYQVMDANEKLIEKLSFKPTEKHMEIINQLRAGAMIVCQSSHYQPDRWYVTTSSTIRAESVLVPTKTAEKFVSVGVIVRLKDDTISSYRPIRYTISDEWKSKGEETK